MRIVELRLDELTGYRNNPVFQLFQQSKDIDSFVNALEESDYNVKKLGQGVFGVVFDKPGSRDVYKVFTARDKGYIDFLKYVKANQDNPHLPRIYGGIMRANMPLNDVSYQGKDWIIVRMEKLQPAGKIYPDELDMARYMQYAPVQKPSEKEWSSKAHQLAAKKAWELKEEFPQLAEVLDWIVANQDESTGKYLDLHDENIMRRGDTVVIIDPYSYFGD